MSNEDHLRIRLFLPSRHIGNSKSKKASEMRELETWRRIINFARMENGMQARKTMRACSLSRSCIVCPKIDPKSSVV